MNSKINPLITVVIPTKNQGIYIEECIVSILNQHIPIEIFIMDGGSNDETLNIIKKWNKYISKWRSHKDDGQSAAINEGVALGTAPYICWINSDDYLLDNGLSYLLEALEKNPDTAAVYGNAYLLNEQSKNFTKVWVQKFSKNKLATRCIISQPATLIRRCKFEQIGGLNEDLFMSSDYDLWWRLYLNFGKLHHINKFIAVNRFHVKTKTNNNRSLHYKESIGIVRKYNKYVPFKWFLYWPYSVVFKAIFR
jgi:glycosyltransferase involved in cell wall biosynthesis